MKRAPGKKGEDPQSPGASSSDKTKRSAVGKKSKRKGKNAEKEVCAMLDAWWGVPEKTFVPSRGSGGWKRHSTSQAWEPGDITSREPALTSGFRFIIDVKKHERWDFYELFSAKRKDAGFLPWWEKLVEEARIHDKCPLLIVQQSNKPTLFITDLRSWGGVLGDLIHQAYRSAIFCHHDSRGNLLKLCIVPSDIFMGMITPQLALNFKTTSEYCHE